MRITLHPHRPSNPRAGAPLDKFVAELPDGTRLPPSRSAFYATARALLALGYPETTILDFYHTGATTTAASQTIAWLAQWSVSESDRGGLQRRPFQPWPGIDSEPDLE